MLPPLCSAIHTKACFCSAECRACRKPRVCCFIVPKLRAVLQNFGLKNVVPYTQYWRGMKARKELLAFLTTKLQSFIEAEAASRVPGGTQGAESPDHAISAVASHPQSHVLRELLASMRDRGFDVSAKSARCVRLPQPPHACDMLSWPVNAAWMLCIFIYQG